jgi:hypothetical protein
MPTRFKPGDMVPNSGIYRVTHTSDHEPVHTVTLLGGNTFPRCHGCSYPNFELTEAAISAALHDQFKVATPKHRGVGGVKRALIFGVLFLFLTGGAFLIWSADHLADISWIASTGKFLLYGNKGALTHEAPEHELLTHFFNEMGIAFVVAAILGSTFEFFMRRREERALTEHIRQIEEAALLSLLGYFMPRSLSHQVRQVFEQQIMRSHLKLIYTFQKPTVDLERLSSRAGIEASDLVVLNVRVEYDLVNLTTTKKKHLIHHGFESVLPFGDEYDKFLNLTVWLGDKVCLAWPKGRNEKKVCQSRGPHPCIRVLKLKRLITLRAGQEFDSGRKKQGMYHVAVEYQLVRRRRDLDSWTTWLPADRLDVTVDYEAVPDLDFYLDRTHPDDFREVKPKTKNGRRSQTKDARQWMLPSYSSGSDGKQQEVSAAVLPYQGFILYWFPRTDESLKINLSTPPVESSSSQ